MASLTGSRCSNRGSLTPNPARPEVVVQGESQGHNGCEVADEAVVVRKFRPVKPGNSVEGKTGTTAGGGSAGRTGSKALVGCEGRKSLMSMTDDDRKVDAAFTSCPTGQGSELRRCGSAVASALSERGSRTIPWRQIAKALVPGRTVRNRPAARPTLGVVITEMSRHEDILQSLRAAAVDAASV